MPVIREDLLSKERLYTKDGIFVATVGIVPGDPRPDFIIWGNRVFHWSNAHQRYLEGVAYIALATF